jgi:hypothetical protein
MEITEITDNFKRKTVENMIEYMSSLKNGESYDIKGRQGDKTVKIVKRQNDKYYEKDNAQDEWKEFDLVERTLKSINRFLGE